MKEIYDAFCIEEWYYYISEKKKSDFIVGDIIVGKYTLGHLKFKMVKYVCCSHDWGQKYCVYVFRRLPVFYYNFFIYEITQLTGCVSTSIIKIHGTVHV